MPMRTDLPDIWKDAQRVRAALRQAVMRMGRDDRYSTGTELNDDARKVVRAVRLACLQRDPRRKRQLAQLLSDAIDELKDSMQLAQDVSAFRSVAEFEAVARLII